MSNKTLRIETVVFRRTEDSQPERGLLFNEGDGALVDMDGKVVYGPIWDSRSDSHMAATVHDIEEARTK